MSDFKITTNNVPRVLLAAWELPKGVLENEFAYIIPEGGIESEELDASNRFFKYRGSWYDTNEFEHAPLTDKYKDWNGVQTQSYFDAIVIRYVQGDYSTYDYVVVGHATW